MSDVMKFKKSDVASLSPKMAVALNRWTEWCKNGDTFTFAGLVVKAHCSARGGLLCNCCCFDGVSDVCAIVCCMPYERKDYAFAWFSIEPEGKEESHE